ncbi:MAG: hypothetical protein M5R36_13170 [Deltaproteobacteria bacterium]|nr:hypothetical protein [Deltaproteobacteria bacterium]
MESPFDENGDWSGGFAVRRSFIDFILPEVIPEDEARFTLAPRFYDYQAAVAWRPNAANTLQMFAVGADDRLGLVSDETEEDAPTADQAFDVISWFHRPIFSWTLTPSADINNRLGISPNYQEVEVEIFNNRFFRLTIQQIDLRDDLTIDLADWNTLGIGFDASYNDVDLETDLIRPPKEGDPGSADIFNEQSLLFDEAMIFIGGNAYLEDQFKFGRALVLTPGARIFWGQANFPESDTDSFSETYVDPRFFARVNVTDRAALKGGVGIYHQVPEADEMIEPYGTPKVESERAVSYNGGVEYRFDEGYSLDAQGYYKRLDSLVARTGADEEEPYDNAGIGRIYGAELLVRKELTDRLYGWLSYTFTVSERRDRPGEDWRYFDQDQRHNAIILASYRIGELWRVGAKFQYATGLPYTDVETAIYNADTDSYIPVYSEDVNEQRMADFHQLDIRGDKLWRFSGWTLNTYLDIQNVYAKRQPVGFIYNADYTEKREVSFPSFYPTLGLQARW